MKMQLKSMLLLMGVSFIIFTGFKNADRQGTHTFQTHTNPSLVTIIGTYDFSTFPNVLGTFITTGALTISGNTTMDIGLNTNGTRAHCVVTLVASDGSITIHQECNFATPTPQGRWEIVSGTGAYTNLKGNGPLTMPGDEENMTGVIY